MAQLITVTDMIRSFSDIVGRVHYKGETFDIKKGVNIVARLSPVKPTSTIAIKDLNKFFKTAPHLEAGDIEEFENSVTELRTIQDMKEINKWD